MCDRLPKTTSVGPWRRAISRWLQVLGVVGFTASSSCSSPPTATTTPPSTSPSPSEAPSSSFTASTTETSVDAPVSSEQSASAALGSTTTTDEDTASSLATDAAHDPNRRVSGRVIDFWEHPVPNAPIRIGELEAMTDAYGAFTVNDVPNEYDVSLAVRIVGDTTEVYAWHFVGLTRRDPTLQIYKGLSQHTAPFTLAMTGFNPEARWRGEVGLGGQHGQRSYPLGESIETVAGWRGPGEQTSPVRVLLWSTTEEAPNTPAQYLFTDARTLPLADSQAATLAVTLPDTFDPLPHFAVGFTTIDAPNTSHLATSYVRFAGGPSIQVAQVPRLSDTTEPFVVNVPQLADASTTLAALSGNGANSTSFVITYAPQLSAPETVSLAFPTVAPLDAPADAVEGVTTSTQFTWKHTAGTYIAVFEDLAVFQTVFVVTDEPATTVPDLKALGIYYPHDGPYRWTVESHGVAQSIDELCEAAYLDPFSGDFLYPIGPRSGQGRFWRTEARTFKFD